MGVVTGASAVVGAVRNSRGRHPLRQRVMAVFPMLRSTLTGRWANAPRFRIFAALAGLLYVVSPLDILPEFLLGPFGLGDDIALAAVAVAALLSSAEDWLDDRELAAAGGSPTASASTRTNPAPGAGDVIQGVVIDRH